MKKESKRILSLAVCFLAAFVLWTVLVGFVDVRAIGPRDSVVGFATLNRLIHGLTGVNMELYTITDWLGLVPVFFGMGFAVLGLVQWVKRKSILKVDYSILMLGLFYIVVIAVYILFENVVINYRPTLINGYLEVSYPSSTTLLVMCVMPTSAMQLNSRIKNNAFRKCVVVLIYIFIAFMVTGRLISGVHWLTDIIGGALFSIGIVLMYRFIIDLKL